MTRRRIVSEESDGEPSDSDSGFEDFTTPRRSKRKTELSYASEDDDEEEDTVSDTNFENKARRILDSTLFDVEDKTKVGLLAAGVMAFLFVFLVSGSKPAGSGMECLPVGEFFQCKPYSGYKLKLVEADPSSILIAVESDTDSYGSSGSSLSLGRLLVYTILGAGVGAFFSTSEGQKKFKMLGRKYQELRTQAFVS